MVVRVNTVIGRPDSLRPGVQSSAVQARRRRSLRAACNAHRSGVSRSALLLRALACAASAAHAG